ncbi:MAG: hypothetical protein WDW36_006112 [Sanguina aurantia]
MAKRAASTSTNAYFVTVLPGVSTIITLSPYYPYEVGSAQMTWLVATLAAINRVSTPWLIVQFHAPWYVSVGGGDFKSNECMRQAMEDIFFQAKVNFVFSGHAHQYERSYPVYQHQAMPNAPVYFLIGNGGTAVGSNWIDQTTSNAACAMTPANAVTTGVAPSPWLWDKSFYYPVNATVGAIQTCVSFQDVNGMSGQGLPEVSFCPVIQPLWSAYRASVIGPGMLSLKSALTATWTAYDNSGAVSDSATYQNFQSYCGCLPPAPVAPLDPTLSAPAAAAAASAAVATLAAAEVACVSQAALVATAATIATALKYATVIAFAEANITAAVTFSASATAASITAAQNAAVAAINLADAAIAAEDGRLITQYAYAAAQSIATSSTAAAASALSVSISAVANAKAAAITGASLQLAANAAATYAATHAAAQAVTVATHAAACQIQTAADAAALAVAAASAPGPALAALNVAFQADIAAALILSGVDSAAAAVLAGVDAAAATAYATAATAAAAAAASV